MQGLEMVVDADGLEQGIMMVAVLPPEQFSNEYSPVDPRFNEPAKRQR